jgi:hypothetical protein
MRAVLKTVFIFFLSTSAMVAISATDRDRGSAITIKYHSMLAANAAEEKCIGFDLANDKETVAKVAVQERDNSEAAKGCVIISGVLLSIQPAKALLPSARVVSQSEEAVICRDLRSQWYLVMPFVNYDVVKQSHTEVLLKPGPKEPKNLPRINAYLFYGTNYHSDIWATGGAGSQAPVEPLASLESHNVDEQRTVIPAFDTDCNHLTAAKRLTIDGKVIFDYETAENPNCYIVHLPDGMKVRKARKRTPYKLVLPGKKYSILFYMNADFRIVSRNTLEITLDYQKGQNFGFTLVWRDPKANEVFLGGVSPWVVCN